MRTHGTLHTQTSAYRIVDQAFKRQSPVASGHGGIGQLVTIDRGVSIAVKRLAAWRADSLDDSNDLTDVVN
jgi:hypothetical protein